MDIQFNAREVFEIAEKIERNGVKYYSRAAELFDDPGLRNMFLMLAEWEKVHEEFFAGLRRQLSEQGSSLRTFRPEDKLSLEAQAMAGLAVFGIRPDPSDELTGRESRVDVIKKAIEKEKDSITYYSGLKNFVADHAGKDKIDDIIAEEIRHVGILNQALEQWLQVRISKRRAAPKF